ncbi:MAG TPA: transcriptional regulator CynR [Hyphomonas atlantica]|uniref:Transcriptional regulator CynR n=1 Tax=Hyphomonas atlantica TaxID=1280948 RepID=A0A356WBB6_9PROT|nr:LysR family transcriptional regulator [Actibacterium sp.]HBQ50232.1 transcriptional regulator CynR [Hyphomonas atlantica]|tara:strand:+ start:1049 stop:1945 length:897 start_codon:yes stop_codon:yes gene_type:complete
MDLRHLRYFQAVAEELSFTRAAEQLGISQPGLSHQIRQLEDELGATLFDRLGRRIRLTAAGTLFARHASSVLRGIVQAETDMADFLGMQSGMLRVGAVQSFNAYLIPPVLSEFRRIAPGITLQIFELSMPAIEEQVITGEIDIGVGFAPPDNDLIRAEMLFQEALLAAVDTRRDDLPDTITIARAVQEPLAIFTTEMFTRRLIDQYFTKAGVSPNPVLEANTIESLLRAVPDSDMLTILPERALEGRSGLRAITLSDPRPERAAAVLSCRGAWRPKSAQLFEDLLRHRVRDGVRMTAR